MLSTGSEDALHLLVDRSMRVAETALHSYRTQDKAAGDKAALLLQAVKLLSLLSKCAMPNGGDVSALFEEHMRNAANRRYRTLKSELQPSALGSTLSLDLQEEVFWALQKRAMQTESDKFACCCHCMAASRQQKTQ